MLNTLSRWVGRDQYRYVKVDPKAVIATSTISTVGITTLGVIGTHFGAIEALYTSPYVLLAALCSNRVCIRAGLISAGLGIILHSAINVPIYGIAHAQVISYFSMIAVAILVARRVHIDHVPRLLNPPSDTLPFVSTNGDGDQSIRSFWDVRPSGVWGEDCEVGEAYGQVYVNSCRHSKSPLPLAWVCEEMIRRGKMTGIEVGFFSSLARALRAVSDHDTNNASGQAPARD